jgi:hypothetical protein
MAEVVTGDGTAEACRRAAALAADGDVRAAVEVLMSANRAHPHGDLERALVRLRREGPARVQPDPPLARPRIVAEPGHGVVEVAAADLDAGAVRSGWARSGCVLVRGLVPRHRVDRLVAGIDAALAASDAAASGEPVDPAWFDPGPMPDRVPDGLPEAARRAFLRDRGGMWTVDSPRMLFELLDTVDAVGLGALMTDVLGQRPLLSALKCTLRRVPPDLEVIGGWHQDGAFLGEQVGAFNFWLSLSSCGRDAPGLDLLPRRVERVIPSDPAARFDWSLSDAAVLEVAGDTAIVRPQFEPGDALLFDQLLVHRTAVSPEMTKPRHAIESWFFAPSAYPDGQLPLLY